MEGITIAVARENVTKSPICGQKKLTVLFTHDLETFQFFAAVVLIAHLVGCHNTLTILGAHLYFLGRIFYAGASMAGFPLVRSLSWNIPTSGILLFVIALLS
jgi:uncharacterized MAPEG superfamily protein